MIQLRHIAALCAFLWLSPAWAQTLVPPKVVGKTSAAYPVGHKEASKVELIVGLNDEGTIIDVSVGKSGGADFDQAAIAAMRQWKFEPATRDGSKIPARIKIEFDFPAPPEEKPAVEVAVPIVAVPKPEPTPEPKKEDEEIREVVVRGAKKTGPHGASEFEIPIGQMSMPPPPSNSGKMLEMAGPSVFVANEGGEGHASQVFLRGFNAETGQAIEFTANGIPLNDVDNPDAHGYADTNFIIPEVVKNLRLVEGPFDPHQGDFAVAGSMAFDLGVVNRGLRFDTSFGSFSSKRLMALWAPAREREGTFAAVQFWNTDGFGSNRSATKASAIAQYEGEFGRRGLWRLLAISYATHYKSAGVVREDMVNAGQIGFYDTLDPSQGGDSQRHSLSFEIENPIQSGVLKQQVFLSYRTNRILEDFTGFLLDTQEAGESIHPQRGDGVLKSYEALTLGARGSYRLTGKAFGREHSLELGYYGRYDHTIPELDRVRFGTQIPYRLDEALTTDVFNLAGYIDLDLHPLSWLTLRGGLRQEFFNYSVLDRCETAGNYKTNADLDVACPSYDRSGSRLPGSKATASGSMLAPKISAIAQLPANFSLTGSYGVGASSMDPSLIEQDQKAPFFKLWSSESGLMWRDHREWNDAKEWLDLNARLIGFYTHVDAERVFDPFSGTNGVSGPSSRKGFVGAARASTRSIEEMASVTYSRAEYEAPASGLVPFAPSWIARSLTTYKTPLPWVRPLSDSIMGTFGLGLNYVGQRALTQGQFSDAFFQMDATAEFRWRIFKLGARVDNLTNAQFQWSQFYYPSDFQSREYATRVSAVHYTAAPPRMVLLTFGLSFDDEGVR